MKCTLIAALMLALPLAGFAQQSQGGKLFTYPYTIDDLPNGLRLITVPTDYPNLVALYIVVSTGSRNEIEQGKSGYAHLFQHLKYAPDAYKTETRAVLGEFNKNSADPEEKLFEVLRATAYKRHTYEH